MLHVPDKEQVQVSIGLPSLLEQSFPHQPMALCHFWYTRTETGAVCDALPSPFCANSTLVPEALRLPTFSDDKLLFESYLVPWLVSPNHC